MNGKYEDLTGRRFGPLKVLYRAPDKESYRGQPRWVCKCDCGRTRELGAREAKNKKGCSCGLFSHVCKQRYGIAFGNLYARYKNQAKARGYTFQLTKREFKLLISQPCYYCGELPTAINRTVVRGKTYTCKYNGIDRLNNALGYIKSNCVSCCGTCNEWKRNYSIEYFLAKVVEIYNSFVSGL